MDTGPDRVNLILFNFKQYQTVTDWLGALDWPARTALYETNCRNVSKKGIS